MSRPDWQKFYSDVHGYVLCRNGDVCSTMQGTYAAWANGMFDTPVYATKTEMMDRIADRLIEKGIVKP